MRKDLPIVGFIIGALMPLLGYLVVYFIFRGASQSIENFTLANWPNSRTFSKILTLSLLANLIPFVYCNFKRYDYILRGIFIATMIYVLFIVLLMFVW